MWPAVLPERIRKDRYRRAEVRVYDQLNSSLKPGWTVFYSRPWLGISPTGAERDGEADFVVVHPQYGFLALEVKGGGISYDPALDVWQSRDSDGVRHNIKNPFAQAKRAKHELLAKLRERPDWPQNRFVRARHGVIFPDAENPPRNLGPDMPRELICCRPALSHIDEWIESRLSGGDEDELGRDGVAVFERLLAQPFTLRVPLGHVLEDDEHAIDALTPEQFHILEAISENRRVAVGGGAGTGKTVLAAEDAVRHALQGNRTLLTCLSASLAEALRSRLGNTTVRVLSFPELCREGQRLAGLPDLPFSADSSPEALLDASARNPTLRFDVIVVDEAQDFPSHWWIALDALRSDAEDSKLHAFYDSNQSIYGRVASELAGFSLLPIHLSRNLRNTKAIHAAAYQFYEGLPVRADGPPGVSISWIECSEEAIGSEVIATVRRLIERESVPADEIAVLAPIEGTLDSIKAGLGKIAGRVTFESVSRFKGLERSVVVLVATREMADQRELAYVALSRARTHLVVIGSREILHWLRKSSTQN
jgi:hypothetical protein